MSAPLPADSEYLKPLAEVYAEAGLALPRIERIDRSRMPEPYRTMLVHDNDMTPTLEQHYARTIHLHVIRSERRGNDYHREVVLRLDGTDKPVEFGANHVDLERYPEEARDLILQEYVPLGSILAQFSIVHTCHPAAYLRITADPLISRELQVAEGTTLYGRRNTLMNPQGQALSDIVEILPLR